jgi:hypothetical protein
VALSRPPDESHSVDWEGSWHTPTWKNAARGRSAAAGVGRGGRGGVLRSARIKGSDFGSALSRVCTARMSRGEPCDQRRSAEPRDGGASATRVKNTRWLAGQPRRADERRWRARLCDEHSAPEHCTKRRALRSRTGGANNESRQPNGEAQPAARRVQRCEPPRAVGTRRGGKSQREGGRLQRGLGGAAGEAASRSVHTPCNDFGSTSVTGGHGKNEPWHAVKPRAKRDGERRRSMRGAGEEHAVAGWSATAGRQETMTDAV